MKNDYNPSRNRGEFFLLLDDTLGIVIYLEGSLSAPFT